MVKKKNKIKGREITEEECLIINEIILESQIKKLWIVG
jgi:hypothetical protein